MPFWFIMLQNIQPLESKYCKAKSKFGLFQKLPEPSKSHPVLPLYENQNQKQTDSRLVKTTQNRIKMTWLFSYFLKAYSWFEFVKQEQHSIMETSLQLIIMIYNTNNNNNNNI